MRSTSESLEAKLRAAFDPDKLEVVNESHLHAGHQAAFDGSGETHLRIKIVAAKFDSLSRIERHRAINALASEEYEKGLHALAIEAHAPGEEVAR